MNRLARDAQPRLSHLARVVVAAALVSSVAGCGTNNNTPPSVPTEAHPHAHEEWSYKGEAGPEAWARLKDGAACDGQRQSPVNIVTENARPLEDADFKDNEYHYTPETHVESVTNNGHTIRYDFDPKGNYIVHEGARFELSQVHFHAPSEHTINGVRYPLEMHEVHTSDDGGYIVFSVLFEQGPSSEEFTFLETFLPVTPGETKPVDASHVFGETASDDAEQFFYYEGSLTTPPCTERVEWIVRRTPATASEAQIARLTALMPEDNFRDVQPLNGRTVRSGTIGQTQ